MPKFEVVSEYKPSGEPRKSGTVAGTPGCGWTGQAKPAPSKVLTAPKRLCAAAAAPALWAGAGPRRP